MRTTFTILFLAFFFTLNAQSKFRVNQYCEKSNTPFDVILLKEKKVRFQIIDYVEMKYGKWNGEYSVVCILPDYSTKSNKSEIKAIAKRLKKLNPKFTKFTFFKSCEVYEIYISSTLPTGKLENKLKDGYLGEFEILN